MDELYEKLMTKFLSVKIFLIFQLYFYRVYELRESLEICESYRYLLSLTVGTSMQVCVPGMTYVVVD